MKKSTSEYMHLGLGYIFFELAEVQMVEFSCVQSFLSLPTMKRMRKLPNVHFTPFCFCEQDV